MNTLGIKLLKNIKKFMKKSDILTIILNWNNTQDTLACLNSLQESTLSIDILVIDNNSRAEEVKKLQQLAQKFPQVKFVYNNSNLGFVGGNNQGMAVALKENYPYVLLLNNDTVVDKNCLALMRADLEQNQQAGIAGPKIFYYAEPDKIWHTAGVLNHWLAKGNGLRWQTATTPMTAGIDFITGCCFLARTVMLKEIGLFDEQFFAYLEDVDLSQRAKEHGWKLLYEPRAHIWHKVSSASGGSAFNPIPLFLRTRNRILYQKKHATFWQKIIFFFYHTAFVKILCWYGLFKFKPKISQAVLKGYLSGYLNPKIKLNKNFPNFTFLEN